MNKEYKALEMYTAGIKVVDIAEELGISAPQVYKLLDVKKLMEQVNKDKIAAAVKMYGDTDTPVNAICSAVGISPPTLYKHVHAAGLSRRQAKRRRQIDQQERDEDIAELYTTGTAIIDICAIYSITPPIVYRALRNQGVKLNRKTVWL